MVFFSVRSSSPKAQTPPEEVIEKAPTGTTATTAEGTGTSAADAPAAAASTDPKP